MKTLLSTLLFLTLTVSAVYSTSRPEVLISSPEIEVVTVESLAIFKSSSFDAISENLIFETVSNISVIQIFNADNQLEFQLPVMASNVQIHKNLFEVGDYKIGFILEGGAKVHFTKVKIK